MKTNKYLKCRVVSCSNRVIELNLEMLILTRFVMTFFYVRIKILMLNIFKMEKIIYQKHRVGLNFNCVIELNQKMLILERFVTKNYCLCDDDN